MGRRPSLLALVFLAAGALSRAGGDTPVREELADEVRREVGTLAVRLGYPQRLSVAVGVLAFRQPRSYDCTTVCGFKGLLAQVEAGTGGGVASLGWGSLVGEKRSNRFFLRDVYVGYAVKGSVLRTWGETPLDPASQTLVGVEGEFAVSVACFTFGVLRRVSSAPGAPAWRLTGGIGWGF